LGDYNAACVDPVDDLTFWTLVEYAAPQVAGTSYWGTWWGSFQVPSGPATAVTLTPSPCQPAERRDVGDLDGGRQRRIGKLPVPVLPAQRDLMDRREALRRHERQHLDLGHHWLATGTYYALVYARSAGSTAPWEAVSPQLPYVLQASSGPPRGDPYAVPCQPAETSGRR